MKGLGHVDRGRRGLLEHLAVVLAEAVEGRAALDGHAHLAHLGEADGVVQPGIDRFAQVGAYLGLVHVEGRHGHDVPDVIAAQLDVHEARDGVVLLGVAVVGDPLNQRAGAIADTGYCEADGTAHRMSPS
jgi:hypothetical protein